jgi:hypothetical protein
MQHRLGLRPNSCLTLTIMLQPVQLIIYTPLGIAKSYHGILPFPHSE